MHLDIGTQKTNTILIRTPEGITFPLLLAGPVTRFLAWAIDLACIWAVWTAIAGLLKILHFVSPDFSTAVGIIFYFIVSIGYSIFFEWRWRGQTIGKRLLRLRVMDERGLQLHFVQIVIRNLLRPIDSLPLLYSVGGLACLLTRCGQRLGDIAAGSIVIRTPQTTEPNLDQILSSKFNCLREYPHLAARLRQLASRREASIALQALLRRDELNPQARVDLFEKLAAHFRSLAPFPQEATEGIPDEQYVRNVVDVLFRTDLPRR
ncbi:MAG: RDD family protein [Pseudomonadota bacterium]